MQCAVKALILVKASCLQAESINLFNFNYVYEEMIRLISLNNNRHYENNGDILGPFQLYICRPS